jgi:TonB-dependent receptor
MNFFNSTSLRALTAASVACIAICSSAYAQATRKIDIAPQTLITALEEFGRQTGIEIMYDRVQIAGKNTGGVRGEYLPGDALNLLLAGTGTVAEKVNANTFLIKVTGAATPATTGGQSPSAAAYGDGTDAVIVIGARKAQQSANERKKRAKTATDSIVADDVGSFPDANLSEALSRIPGVFAGRNEAGEGEGVNIRGEGADLTRVELDGATAASGGASLAISGTESGGRGADMRELPADLIKSVDVIKGQTADMAEGGLAGTVKIQTRSGLDFKKPYFQLRLSEARNSLSEKWAPDVGIVASRKFFNNRLGLLFNLSASHRLNDSHQLNGAGSSNAQGYSRLWDFDNSPEKTFAYNPALVTGERATQPVNTFALASGTGNFTTHTPQEIVTLAANAKTKAECLSAFSLYTDAQLNTISAGSNNANRATVQNQRINEQVSCLNQWNDYSPGLYRDVNLTQYEDRMAWDLRADYKLTDNLTVYLKYSEQSRTQHDNRRNRTRGQIGATTTAGNFTQTLVSNTNIPNGSIRFLAPAAAGYYLYNGAQPTGTTTLDSTQGGSTVNNGFPVYGAVLNVNPSTVVVDASHHVTHAEISNQAINYDILWNNQIWDSRYLQAGGEYRKGHLKVDFMANHTESSYSRDEKRYAINLAYGNGTMDVLPNGLWDIKYPASFDPNNMANAVTLQPLTAVVAGQARYIDSNRTLQFNPRMTEGKDDAAQFNVTYNIDQIPFFTLFKTGARWNKSDTRYWDGSGITNVTGTVMVPNQNFRTIVRVCENLTTTTLANQCVYGYTSNPTTTKEYRSGTITLPVSQLGTIYQNAMENLSGNFMPGYEGVPELAIWNSLDLDKMMAQMPGLSNFNLNCMKVCAGTDGKLYEQPVRLTTEETFAAYYMAEFEQKLPFNLEFNGNFGVRMVKSKVNGSGRMTLQSIRKNVNMTDPTLNWNPTTGNGNVTTTAISKPVAFERELTSWMPSYNANLWIIPDQVVLRYSWAKAIAFPPIGRLWPVGTCTIDERIEDRISDGEDDLDMGCTSTIGNPALKPYKANKTNTSLEYYPNKDTYFALSYYRSKTIVGGPVTRAFTDEPLFDGTDEVDPITGTKFSDYRFSYTSYVNGEGNTKTGWEFTTKTALTWMPWRLRYTGFDFNVSTNASAGGVTFIDPITGENVGVRSRADYYVNLSLWYDDGKTNARVSYQAISDSLRCVSGCGNAIDGLGAFPNSNPSDFNRVGLPYNPGEPYYDSAVGWLDAKATYKFNRNFEMSFEGRNLLKQARTIEGTRSFTAQQNIWSAIYAGRRFVLSGTYKY